LSDPIESLALIDEEAGSRVVLAPARGGLVTRFFARGRDLLYLDEATLRDPDKNVRGGIPVLFPSPGRLAGDAWARGGHAGTLKQHGFARNLPWRVVETDDGDAARALLELDDGEATRALWPWAFALRIEHQLAGDVLTLAIEVVNRDARPMPFGIGFHPYFTVDEADKAQTRIPTAARRAFDNVTKRVVDLDGIDLTAAEVDLHLEGHGASEASLVGPRAVTLRGSPEFTHWVIWTLRGRDFVCLEPWSCPGDALNSGDRLIELAPGARASLRLEIAPDRLG
jgi:galactose mutarotase-like enzyme